MTLRWNVAVDLCFFHLDQVAHLIDHTANLLRVFADHRFIQFLQAESDQNDLVLSRTGYSALHERDFQLFYSCLRHVQPKSSTFLPRNDATCSGLRSLVNPLIVALTTLWGLLEPRDLQSTFRTPTTSSTDLLAPPAIKPVPSEAGLSNTLPAP